MAHLCITKAAVLVLALVQLAAFAEAQPKCASYGRNNFACDLSKGLCCSSPYTCSGAKNPSGSVTCALPQETQAPKCASYGRNNFACDLSKGLCCSSPYTCSGAKNPSGSVMCALPPSQGTQTAVPVSASSGRKLTQGPKCASYGKNNFGCDLTKGLCCMSPYTCSGSKNLNGLVTCALPKTQTAASRGPATSGAKPPLM